MRSLPSLTALRVFETAGKSLSFTLAAKQLHVTQGAVSRQVKQLESFLGVPLFVRLHHKMELTDAGFQLLTKLERSFDMMEEAVLDIREPNQRQKLNIFVSPTYATRDLAPRLADFQNRFPELELSIQDQVSQHTLFDCIIRFGLAEKPRFYSELLRLEQHVAVCTPELVLRSQSLEKESNNLLHILHEGKRLGVWADWLQAAGLREQISPHRGMEFSTMDQVINAVKTGAGFAVIDKYMITKELEKGTLVQFSNVEVSGPYGYWLDILSEKQGLSKVAHFVGWLKGS
ncbi:LysR substrate-binding domain-containing protein [Colwellia psychrerythraea]|uniref:Transcriptional regulator, LysR family n=1 Tax=Colwellia psychrerythraea TaxID=28229 RepID=A0A099K989_COLPS|nr:LysR substrate-binding domain-containing protein [Colwellia psychrerythraea]KGJ86865.1 transcriptional regulator, LysR family [Colwellia psychrerythraea]